LRKLLVFVHFVFRSSSLARLIYVTTSVYSCCGCFTSASAVVISERSGKKRRQVNSCQPCLVLRGREKSWLHFLGQLNCGNCCTAVDRITGISHRHRLSRGTGRCTRLWPRVWRALVHRVDAADEEVRDCWQVGECRRFW